MADNEQNKEVPQPENASDNQKKTIKIVLIVVGVLLVLGVIGVLVLGYIGTRIGSSILDQATDGSVSVSENGFTIEDEDEGFSFSTESELARDFPDEVPLYPNAELGGSSRTQQGEEMMWSANLLTDDSSRDVLEFYEDALQRDGWETQSSFESGEMSNISAENAGQNLAVIVGIIDNQQNGETTINVSVVRAEE